ncbi:MAG: hypothetical protein IJH61_08600, partial [Eubacteriaceae bacterium]|nr:hypothetical protein [Eubacteriaceae bacterium]
DINDIAFQKKMSCGIGKKFPQFSRNYPALYYTYPAQWEMKIPINGGIKGFGRLSCIIHFMLTEALSFNRLSSNTI